LMIVVNNYNDEETINIGTGQDLSIKEIAELVKEIVGFSGEIIWDKSKPDGTPRKLLDISKLKKLGYEANQDLVTEIHKTYDWFKKELLQAQSAIRL
jgi:GDP-L-fucose synthase